MKKNKVLILHCSLPLLALTQHMDLWFKKKDTVMYNTKDATLPGSFYYYCIHFSTIPIFLV